MMILKLNRVLIYLNLKKIKILYMMILKYEI